MPNSPGSRSGYWVLGLVLSTKKRAHARTRKTSNFTPHHPAPHTHTANGALTARCPLRGPLRSSIFKGGEDAQLTKTAVTGGYRNSTQHASATAQNNKGTPPCRLYKPMPLLERRVSATPRHRCKKSAAHETRHAQATGIRSTPLLGWVRLHFRAVVATTSVHLPPRPQH